MKTKLLMLLLLLSATAFPQNVVVSATKMNVAYLNVDNPLDAIAEGYRYKSIFLTTDNGTIDSSYSYRFTYHPERTGTATIKVCTLKGKDTLVLGKALFRVYSYPNPIATVAGSKGGTISKSDLLEKNALIPMEEFWSGVCIMFRIPSYTAIIVRKNKSVFIKDVEGNIFTDDIKKEFELLEKDDKVCFTNILVELPGDKRIVNVNTIAFTIE